MIGAIILILIVLWFLGYIHISGINIPNFILFSINGQPITLWDILILAVILWAISILPNPFRAIAGVLLILWILAVLGIFAFAGASVASIIIIAIIIGLVISLF